jgi:hypothetical protein
MVHVAVVDMLANVPPFISDKSETMMVNNSNAMSEGDDDTQEEMAESMVSIQGVNEVANENEQKSVSNKKYYMVFKPSVSPISNRLRRKK